MSADNVKKCRKDLRAKRILMGLCTRCGARPPKCDRRLCEECNIKHLAAKKKRYEKKAASGRCVRCGKNWTCGGVLCEICYLKRVSLVNLGIQSRWIELKELFVAQQGKCPYTGRQLTLGFDTSLDHVVPRSRGGDHANSNLQWVYLPVNTLKSNMTHDEFCAIVGEIAAHMGI